MNFKAMELSKWLPDDTSRVERIITILLIAAPLFYLSVPHWISNVSVLSVVLILVAAILSRNYFTVYKSSDVLPILGMFIAYFLAILFSQWGRGVFVSREYLDQTRWLLGLPIFAFMLYCRIDFALILRWIAPFIVLFAWFSSTFLIPSDAWGNRATIEFMDPLAFGFLNLSIGLICLVTAIIELKQRRINALLFLSIAGCLLGIYLSLRSGSRTGWFAFPFVLFLLVRFWYGDFSKNKINAVLLIALPLVGLFLVSDTVSARLSVLVSEIYDYPWNGGVAPDTSVGLRITFYRLGFHYFSENPIFGWGERGYSAIKDTAEVAAFSSAHARDFAFNALFHSEWTTQGVRYGLLGVVAVFWVFAAPFYYFLKNLRTHASAAFMGMVFLMCQFAASFSTEVYSSKGMITFSVIIVSGLLASVLKSGAQAT